MSDFRNKDGEWPSYIEGHKDDIYRIGVVCLNYGYLENMFRSVFTFVLNIGSDQAQIIFSQTQNDDRINILLRSMKRKDLPIQFQEAVSTFISGYQICAANRHLIMHSFHGGTHLNLDGREKDGGIVLARYSKSGALWNLFGVKEKLERTADDMWIQSAYGVDIVLKLSALKGCLRRKVDYDFERHPLPEKPPLPEKLELHFQPNIQDTSPPPRS